MSNCINSRLSHTGATGARPGAKFVHVPEGGGLGSPSDLDRQAREVLRGVARAH